MARMNTASGTSTTTPAGRHPLQTAVRSLVRSQNPPPITPSSSLLINACYVFRAANRIRSSASVAFSASSSSNREEWVLAFAQRSSREYMPRTH